MNMLKGVLREDKESTTYITINDGLWTLSVITKIMGDYAHDCLCQHEDWDEFLKLVAEYSDYVSE